MIYFHILIPLAGIVANISAQIFAYKYLTVKRLLKSEYFGFLCGVILLAFSEVFAYGEGAAQGFSLIFADLIIYLCLSYCYFNFINMGETARRIRLLRELSDSVWGLDKQELLSKYNAREVVGLRVKRLLNNHQIILSGSRYYIGTPVMLFISRGIVLLKLIVLGRKSEFDLNHG